MKKNTFLPGRFFTCFRFSITYKLLFFLLCLTLHLAEGHTQDLIRISPDLEIHRISDHALVHVSYTRLPGYGRVGANGLIFIDHGEALLLDTPWNDSLTCQLVTWLREKKGLKVIAFIPNHWHEDCMGGLGYIKSQHIPSYANRLTLVLAKEKGLPVPDYGFTDSLRLKVGEQTVFCYYPGAAHTLDNIVTWIPSESILFAGCMCKAANARNPGNVGDGDIHEYPKTIEKVLKKYPDAKIVIPGHGAVGDRGLLLHTLRLVSQ